MKFVLFEHSIDPLYRYGWMDFRRINVQYNVWMKRIYFSDFSVVKKFDHKYACTEHGLQSFGKLLDFVW